VFVFEDANGRTLMVATTVSLKRLIASRLEPPDPHAGPTRRINFREPTRAILAAPVGSAFEADWAYLQLVRTRMPHTYRTVLDRWPAWFLACEPESQFPQFVKTGHPDGPSTTRRFIGPFPDKHSTGRFIDMLVNAFDLCRYQHILVQAPNATACAYKEMGRCPAPCDGSVSLDHYRSQIGAALDFACTPRQRWRDQLELKMQQASSTQSFEAAAQHRQMLERTAEALKPQFALVDDLHHFRFVAVMPSERAGFSRLFLILGGWIGPILDVPLDSDASLQEAFEVIADHQKHERADFANEAIENIGMVCAHLFRPRKSKAAGEFLRLDPEFNAATLRSALRKLNATVVSDPAAALVDQTMESEGAA
jgi:DNA polymerase-3 subunit epsilon